MPRRVTKRKQNKRGKKRTSKSVNRRKTRSVRSVKYLGGNTKIENLQEVIEIKGNYDIKIADCYVFSYMKEIVVLFQLFKGVSANAKAGFKGLLKALANAHPYVWGTPIEHKSISYLLIENLEQILQGFHLTPFNETTYTGVGEAQKYTAQTISFSYTIDQLDKRKPTSNGVIGETIIFDPRNPSPWLLQDQEKLKDSRCTYELNKTLPLDIAIMNAVNKVRDAIEITTPEQAATTPEQAATTPEQAATTPEQAATTPEQAATTPEQVASKQQPSTEQPSRQPFLYDYTNSA